MNTLMLDMTDPAVAEQLADCDVGETKEITLRVTATRKDEQKFQATVDEILNVDYGEEEAAAEGEDSAYRHSQMGTMEGKPMGGKMKPGLMVLIGSDKGR